MSRYLVSPREVVALKVLNVQPLEKHGQLVSVKTGIALYLEDGSMFPVTPDVDVFTMDTLPVAGDFLVLDEALAMKYILPPVTFEKCFQRAVAA